MTNHFTVNNSKITNENITNNTITNIAIPNGGGDCVAALLCTRMGIAHLAVSIHNIPELYEGILCESHKELKYPCNNHLTIIVF